MDLDEIHAATRHRKQLSAPLMTSISIHVHYADRVQSDLTEVRAFYGIETLCSSTQQNKYVFQNVKPPF